MKYIVFLLTLYFCIQFVAADPLEGYVAHSNVRGMIGARINSHGVISAVRYRSPAQLNGLRPGDKIKYVDWRPFSLSRIHGAPGERVTLTIDGETFMRTIVIPFVDYREIDYETDPTRFYEERKIVNFGEEA